MSRMIHRSISPLAVAALAGLSAASVLAAGDGERNYRCRFLGDSNACAPSSVDTDESATRLEPGSYARYLIYLGRSTDEAIAEARARGEEPTLRIVKAQTPRRLTGEAAHQRFLGNEPTPTSRRDTDVANRTMPLNP